MQAPLLEKKPRESYWQQIDVDKSMNIDPQFILALKHFLQCNFKTSDGKHSVNLENPHEVNTLLDLFGAPGGYNNIVGINPAGKKIIVTVKNDIVDGAAVQRYYPTFGEGAYEACVVMKLKGVTECHVPADLLDINGHGIPNTGTFISNNRYGSDRRDYVMFLLRVGIPNLTMQVKNHYQVGSTALLNSLLAADAKLIRLCNASSEAYAAILQGNSTNCNLIEAFLRIASCEDRRFYLDIVYPDSLYPGMHNQLKDHCVATANINDLIDQYSSVTYLTLGNSLKPPIESIISYFQALMLSKYDRHFQKDILVNLGKFHDFIKENDFVSQRLIYELCYAINNIAYYDIEELKTHILRPLKLIELFSKNACHREAPFKIEAMHPAFLILLFIKLNHLCVNTLALLPKRI